MTEIEEKVVLVSDIDIIITIRSGQTELREIQKVLKTLIGSLNFNSDNSLELVLTDQIINIRSVPGKKITTSTTSYHIE